MDGLGKGTINDPLTKKRFEDWLKEQKMLTKNGNLLFVIQLSDKENDNYQHLSFEAKSVESKIHVVYIPE